MSANISERNRRSFLRKLERDGPEGVTGLLDKFISARGGADDEFDSDDSEGGISEDESEGDE